MMLKTFKPILFIIFIFFNITVTQASTIAIVGAGIDPYDSYCRSRLWFNMDEIGDNGIDDDNNGIIDDLHGADFQYNNNNINYSTDSHEAKVIEDLLHAHGDYIMMTDDTNLMIIKIEEHNSKSGILDEFEAFKKGIDYAVTNGANIILMSFGWNIDNPKEFEDIMLKYPEVLFIQAAGNGGYQITIDHRTTTGNKVPNRILVGACDEEGKITEYSTKGELVDVYALGKCDAFDKNIRSMYSGYLGTSYSAPKIAAICSDIANTHPEYKAIDIKNELLNIYGTVVINSHITKQCQEELKSDK